MQQTRNVARKFLQRERVIARLHIGNLAGKEYRIITYRTGGEAYKLYERNDGAMLGWVPVHRSSNFEISD